MHPIDITAAVHKRGTSLAALARQNGLSSSALNYALKNPARRAEEVLSKFLGIAPAKLWPDRYDAQGARRDRRRTCTPRNQNTSAQRRLKGQ